ncbi:MAG TPA: hypothetical protein VFS20_30735 [Longimicrobium sp.]|nr:hypothetical protein [Longimicrobium sp.]
MSIEEFARRILCRELGRDVALHDDRTRPSMYDLRVGVADAPEIAIECVGAVDPVRVETWNIGPANGPMLLQLRSDWHVVLEPQARLKEVRTRLEQLLQRCEQLGMEGFVPIDFRMRRANNSLYSAFKALRIDSVHRFEYPSTGKVDLGMTGVGGSVDTLGHAVPGWIGDFLRAPQRADVLKKLRISGAQQCHVFVPVAFGGVPWAVESYLGSQINTLPPTAPDLPAPVTAAWITYGVNGLGWNGSSWHLFNTTFD